VPDAVVRTMDTAGRAVVVAGGTVILSLLGLAAMGLSYMTGAAVATMVAVAVVVLAALTLLPALLGMLGTRVDRLRLLRPRTRPPDTGRVGAVGARRPAPSGRRAARRHRRPARLAAPVTGLRFGFPDAGNDPAGTSARTAYDLTVEAFGPERPVRCCSSPRTARRRWPPRSRWPRRRTPSRRSARRSPRRTADDAGHGRPGHLAAGPWPPSSWSPTCAPPPPASTSAGFTAAALDQTDDVVGRLPLLVGGVVGLSFLLLLAVFRSPAVAVKAAVLNLASIGAAYGVVSLVLEGGWAGQLVGIDTPTPLPAFVPVLMFAVLFGLSMDYEVFLMSGVREAWARTGDSRAAVVEGMARTGRVITAPPRSWSPSSRPSCRATRCSSRSSASGWRRRSWSTPRSCGCCSCRP
jgi:RND superfamily putative drug exporter